MLRFITVFTTHKLAISLVVSACVLCTAGFGTYVATKSHDGQRVTAHHVETAETETGSSTSSTTSSQSVSSKSSGSKSPNSPKSTAATGTTPGQSSPAQSTGSGGGTAQVSGGTASPCTLYASTTGSDSASGAVGSPFRTVTKLMSSLTAGKTGCLLGGTYIGPYTFSSSGSSDAARVTLMTAPGYPAATLSGSYIYITANYVTLQNLVIVGTDNVVTMQTFGDYVTYKNLDITNNHNGQSCITVGEYSGQYAKVISGFLLDHSKIHDCGMLANGAHDHGLYLAASRSANVTNSWFWGNQGGWAVQLWTDAHSSYIANNVFDANYNGNMIIAGATGSPLGPSSNNLIEKNIFSNPQNRYQVESYWSGGVGTNNVVRNSCVSGNTAFGDFDTGDGGFTTSGITTANPSYVNQAAHNYALNSGSLCSGYGSTGTVGTSS